LQGFFNDQIDSPFGIGVIERSSGSHAWSLTKR
jgi:hypothetical protein